MIQAGTGVSLKNLAITTKSSEESKRLYLLYNAIQNLSALVNQGLFLELHTYVVGTTPGAPTDGSDTWLVPIDKFSLPGLFAAALASGSLLYINNVAQIANTDYTFNVITKTITLLLTTFSTGDVVTILF